MHALITAALLAAVLNLYISDRPIQFWMKVQLVCFGVATVGYWTDWTGRAFRKKAPRAIASYTKRRSDFKRV